MSIFTFAGFKRRSHEELCMSKINKQEAITHLPVPWRVRSILILLPILVLALLPCLTHAQLSSSYYGSSCPSLAAIVKANVKSAINREKRMGASILRLFFHDCFVNVCGSSPSSHLIFLNLHVYEKQEIDASNLCTRVCFDVGRAVMLGCC